MRSLLTALLAVLLLGAAVPVASAAVDHREAQDKAVRALGADRARGVVVFGLPRPLSAGTAITEAGRGASASAASAERSRRLVRAGVSVVRAPRLMRVGRERAWFFYEDQAPNRGFEHAGRVVLVGERTGRVRVSRPLRWVPLVAGHRPAFFRSAAAYHSRRYRVLDRARSAVASTPADGPFAPRAVSLAAQQAKQSAATALAERRACAVRMSDTLGDFYDFAGVDRSRAELGRVFAELATLAPGFRSVRYRTPTQVSPVGFLQGLVEQGCGELLVYAAGAGYRGGAPALNVGVKPRGRDQLEVHDLAAADLEALAQAHPDLQLTIVVDAPFGGRLAGTLGDERNVALLTAGGADELSASFRPRNAGAAGTYLLDFTNRLVDGYGRLLADPAEVDNAIAQQATGGVPSLTGWLAARAIGLTPQSAGGVPVPQIRLPFVMAQTVKGPPAQPGNPGQPGQPGAPGKGDGRPVDPDGPAGNNNKAPVANAQTLNVAEDTASALTLTGSDPNNDPLTYAVTTPPTHGTLTGTAPNLTYTPAAGYVGSDSLTFKVTDPKGLTSSATVTINVTPVNDAPVVGTTGGAVTFLENGDAVVVDDAVSVSDVDSAQLQGATVSITSGRVAGDVLTVTPPAGVTPSYDAATGILTLAGAATPAAYATALKTVAFDSTSDNPGTARTITFVADDGASAQRYSAPASRAVTVTPENDAPTVDTTNAGSGAFTEGGSPAIVDGAVEVDDVDSATLQGATVQITGNPDSADTLAMTDTTNVSGTFSGDTLTLTGAATPAEYETALRSVTFATSGDAPSTATRTLTYKVDDGPLESASDTRTVTVSPANDAPTLTPATGSLTVGEEDTFTVIEDAFTIADADDTAIESATVAITGGYVEGEDVLQFVNTADVTGEWSASTGTLTLTGPDTLADFEAALEAVTYNYVGGNPSGDRTVTFTVDDGDADSAAATRTITVTPENDAPTVDTSTGSAAFTEGATTPALADDGVDVADVDSATLTGGTVAISTGYVEGEDVLAMASGSPIAGTFNATTGTLTLDAGGSVADVESALRHVTFTTSGDAPTTSRTLTFTVSDGAATGSDTRTLTISPSNDAPALAPATGTATVGEDAGPAAIEDAFTITDADDTDIESATVAITSGYAEGDDVLAFADTADVTGDWDAATGELTLTGPDTLAGFADALETVTYDTTAIDPAAERTITFVVNDGGADSNTATRTVTVTPDNDAPTVETSAGDAAFTEGAASPSRVDDGVDVTDGDNDTLTGGSVQITSDYTVGKDVLAMASGSPIAGTFDPVTGTLTLDAGGSVADVQAALRHVTFTTSDDAPGASRTLTFTVDDGTDEGSDTRGLAVSPTNDAPSLAPATGSLTVAEDAGFTAIEDEFTITDADDTNIDSATVKVTTGYVEGEDVLQFVNTTDVTGEWSAATGTLTLTGPDTLADFADALEAVKYDNVAVAPAASREITFTVNDGSLGSNAATRTVTVTPDNDAPVVETTTGDAAFTEGAATPTTIDDGVDVTDGDSATLSGGTVQITTGYASGDDVLAMASGSPIAGTFNATTGTLTLDAGGSAADVQSALRHVTFTTSGDDPAASRTITFTASDSSASGSDTRGLTVTPTNDAPALSPATGTLTVGEDDPATPIDTNLTLTDADNTTIQSAVVAFGDDYVEGGDVLAFPNTADVTGAWNATTGTLTLTGPDTLADFRDALEAVTYRNLSGTPAAERTVTMTANDGDADSNTITRTITVTPTSDPPVLTATSGNAAFTEGAASPALIDDGIDVVDSDSTTLTGGSVAITSGYVTGEDVLAMASGSPIAGTFDAASGTLTLDAGGSVADVQDALRHVTFTTSSDTPATARTITFSASDVDGSGSDTRDLTITPTNDAPVLAPDSGDITVGEDDNATAIAPGLSATDVDSNTMSGATVAFISDYTEGADVLALPATPGITGTFDPATAVLTLSGTASESAYEAALKTVTYKNASAAPGATRTVVFGLTDEDGARSNDASRTIAVTPVNDAPTVDASAGNAAFTENALSPTTIDENVDVADVDTPSLTGATVQITSGYVNGEDVLAMASGSPISGTFTAATGTLALDTGGSPADVQEALRHVTFTTPSENPTTSRTITFTVSDGDTSASDTRGITITPVNDAPALASTATGTVEHIEGAGPTAIDDTLAITDVDSADIKGATARITGNFTAGQDALRFTNTPQITGNVSGDTLTLTGTATKAQYQAALRTVRYENTSDAPSTAERTITFQVDDGEAANHASNTTTRGVTVTPTNDAPIGENDGFAGALGNTRFAVSRTATGPHVAITGDVLTDDVDDHDPDTPANELTIDDSAPITTANGGTVSINDDGQFTYDPPAGYTGDDTFTYTVEDNHPTEPLTDTATATVEVRGPMVWYVEGDYGAAGDGRSHSPLKSLSALSTGGTSDSKDGTNDRIFVYDAAAAYTGGIVLEAGQQLLGEPHGLSVTHSTTGATHNLAPAGGANPRVWNGAGDAINLANGVNVQRVNIGGTPGATTTGDGIDGANVTTATVGANTAIANVNGSDVRLSGGNGNVSIGSTITNSNGRAIQIENRTGGTTTLSGTLNDSGGTGIMLDNNDGSIVDLENVLTLNTNASDAFQAINGGTVIADHASNTLQTTSGRALRVENTTIGTGGLDFRSIAANGATSGIVLNNTGTTAGLSVTGTGSAGTGGTIQNTTSHAISLNTTDHVALNNMAITGPNDSGVHGREVTNFTYTNGSIANAGDTQDNVKDSAFNFGTDTGGTENNVDGTLTITGNTVTNPYGAAIDVHQYSGTLSDAVIQNNTLTSSAAAANSKDDGIGIHLDGSASTVASLTKATIANNTISNFPNGFGIFLVGGNVGGSAAPAGTIGVPDSATNKVLVSGNSITGDATTNLNGAPIHARVLGKGQGNYEIVNNGTAGAPLNNSKDNSIEMGADGAVTADFLVNNNVVNGSDAVFGGGAITFGSGNWIVAGPTTLNGANADVTITNNTVQASVGPGIDTIARDDGGDLDMKIANNNVAAPSQQQTPGIQVQSGSSGGGTAPAVCTNISGNTAGRGAPDGFGDAQAGINLIKRYAASSSFEIHGLSPNPATATQTENYVSGQNPGSAFGAGAGIGNNAWSATRATVQAGTNFGACNLP